MLTTEFSFAIGWRCSRQITFGIMSCAWPRSPADGRTLSIGRGQWNGLVTASRSPMRWLACSFRVTQRPQASPRTRPAGRQLCSIALAHPVLDCVLTAPIGRKTTPVVLGRVARSWRSLAAAIPRFPKTFTKPVLAARSLLDCFLALAWKAIGHLECRKYVFQTSLVGARVVTMNACVHHCSRPKANVR